LGEITKELFLNLEVRKSGLEIDSKFISNIKKIMGENSSQKAR